MPAILTRRRWIAQPAVGPAALDASHPLAKDCVEFYYGLSGPSVWDAARSTLATGTYTNASRDVGTNGVQVTLSGSASAVLAIPSPAALPSSTYTIVMLMRASTDAYAGYEGFWSLADSSNNQWASLQRNNNTFTLGVYHGTIFTDSGLSAETFSPVDGQTYVALGVSYDASVIYWYRDGIRKASALAGATPGSITPDHWNIGNERTAGVARLGSYVLLARWNRKLSDAEHVAFAEQPWQMLRGRVRRSYFAVAAAGGAAGTLKTWNGLARANIKAADGIAIASVKTYDALTP